MTSDSYKPAGHVESHMEHPIWDRFFTLAPWLVTRTREANGKKNRAPKPMAIPMGWGNYFWFVCTASHRIYQNIPREGGFSVGYPTAVLVLMAALAVSPRWGDDSNAELMPFPSPFAAEVQSPRQLEPSLFLGCRLDRVVDNFGLNSSIVGRFVPAQIRAAALRRDDKEDEDTATGLPLLAYASPGRFVTIDKSVALLFPAGFRFGEDFANEF